MLKPVPVNSPLKVAKSPWPVELEIEVDDKYTVAEARIVGEQVRKALIDSIEDVSRADVHLEL